MKNRIHHIFQIPDDGMENAKKKVLKKMDVMLELDKFPILKKIKENNSNFFIVPHDYFISVNQVINKKIIKDADLKTKSLTQMNSASPKTLIIHLYAKRIAAVLILTLTMWFVYKFLLNHQQNTPKEISEKTYADTCKTLACIEREVILNELYYEASEDEMEMLN